MQTTESLSVSNASSSKGLRSTSSSTSCCTLSCRCRLALLSVCVPVPIKPRSSCQNRNLPARSARVEPVHVKPHTAAVTGAAALEQDESTASLSTCLGLLASQGCSITFCCQLLLHCSMPRSLVSLGWWCMPSHQAYLYCSLQLLVAVPTRICHM